MGHTAPGPVAALLGTIGCRCSKHTAAAVATAVGTSSREEEQAGKAWGGMGHIGVVVQQQGQGELTWVAWSTCLHVYPVLVLDCLWCIHCYHDRSPTVVTAVQQEL